MSDKRYIDIVVMDTSNQTLELEKDLAWEEFRKQVESWKQENK